MTGEPQNEDEIRASGFVLYPDGIWRKPPKVFPTSLPIGPAPFPPNAGLTLKQETNFYKQHDPEPKPKTKELNKTELEFLARLQAGVYGKVAWIGPHEGIRLELADKCTYAPDFPLRLESGEFLFYEVKGKFIREDGWIKLKMAARTYHWWRFIKAQKLEGQWTETVIPP